MDTSQQDLDKTTRDKIIQNLIHDFDKALNYQSQKHKVVETKVVPNAVVSLNNIKMAMSVLLLLPLILIVKSIVVQTGLEVSIVAQAVKFVIAFGLPLIIFVVVYAAFKMMVNPNGKTRVNTTKKIVRADPGAKERFEKVKAQSLELVSQDSKTDVRLALNSAWGIAKSLETNSAARNTQSALMTAVLAQILVSASLAQEIEIYQQTRNKEAAIKSHEQALANAEAKIVQELTVEKEALLKTVKAGATQLESVKDGKNQLTAENVDWSGILALTEKQNKQAVKLLERARAV